MRKTYINYISHEIRTPLNAVKLGLQLICEDLCVEEYSRDLIDNLEVTKLACSEALHIFDEMLALDKLEDGLLRLIPEKVSAKELIETSVALLRAQVISIVKRSRWLRAPYFMCGVISMAHRYYHFQCAHSSLHPPCYRYGPSWPFFAKVISFSALYL